MIGSINNTQHLTQKMELTSKQQETEGFKQALEQASLTQDEKELKEACKQVETYMISTILKKMQASTEMGETLIPKGDYEKMFEEQLIDERAKNMTEAGGIGLADMMYKQMTQAYGKNK